MTRPPLLCYDHAIKSGIGVKSVKNIGFAIVAALLSTTSLPVLAQGNAGASYEFVKAVRDRSGGKAQELLAANPAGIVNSRDGDGNTPLIIAVSREDQNWTAFLLSKGADVNLAGKGGDTPVIAAARVGFDEGVDWLLGEGAKVDTANKMGETALIVAVQQRNARLVKLLLDAGADPDKADSAAGFSARDYAQRDTRSRQILQLIEAKKPKR
jgi:ankyrin repeat protein